MNHTLPMPWKMTTAMFEEAFKTAALKQRVVTASVIAAVFLAVVCWSSLFWFQMAFCFLFLVAAWEWANLSGFVHTRQKIIYLIVVMAVACVFQFICQNPVFFPLNLFTGSAFFYQVWIQLLMEVAVIFWALAFLLVAMYPRSAIIFANRYVRGIIGLLVLLPTWAGVVFLKKQHDAGGLVLWVVAMIALADIGAYFTGVRFGKHKLATAVSPGKSWEGVFGGLACNSLLVAGMGVYWHLTVNEVMSLLLVTATVVVFSIVGDLFESMLKRHRGVKDSGTLLPGHGGILDRIDGWMAAVPFFTLAYLLFSV